MALASWMTALEQTRRDEFSLRIGGARMRCLVSGSGPSLLLLHGLLGTADAWGAASDGLAAASTLYAPDALGMGKSDRVAGLDVSLRATTTRLITLMDTQGIERADVVGTSHGGSVALMLAALYPERVRSLILHAPANPFSDIAEPLIRFYRTSLGRWFAGRIPSVPGSVQSLALGRMYGDASRVRAGSLERYMTSLRVPGTVAYVLSILERWERDMAELKEVLPAVRPFPTLLLWGDRDRAVSLRSGEKLLKCFDRGSLVILPGAGHLPHEEVPVAFAGAINRFLSGLDRGPAPEQPTPSRRNRLHIVTRNDAA